MKIAQIMLGKGYGGAERAFVDTCIALSEAGHEVLAIIDRDFSAQVQLAHTKNITVVSLPIFARWDPLARRRLKRIIQDASPDIAHIHLRRAMALAGTVIKKCHVPLVASLHNYGNIMAYHRADGLIALTEGHRNYIIQHAGFSRVSIPPTAVSTIPNFSRFPVSVKTIPENGALKYLAYGRFVPKKGFEVLIDAMALAIKENPNLQLTLIGEGPEKTALLAQIDRHRLGGHVSLSGWQHNLIPLLDQHDVFILPSHSEPFGIVLLEAMARGLGIITTRTEGPGEFLDDSCCEMINPGSATDLAAAIHNVYTDRTTLTKKARKAQQRFEQQFSQQAVIRQLEKKYQYHLLSQHNAQ